jgi:hypothetical protein
MHSVAINGRASTDSDGNALQIAWACLEQTGQIDDPELTSCLLQDTIEHLVRPGERRRLALSNGGITAYERVRPFRECRVDGHEQRPSWKPSKHTPRERKKNSIC